MHVWPNTFYQAYLLIRTLHAEKRIARTVLYNVQCTGDRWFDGSLKRKLNLNRKQRLGRSHVVYHCEEQSFSPFLASSLGAE